MTRLGTGADFDPLTAVHYQETDPGVVWAKDAAPAIDVNPAAPTSGALTPNVIRLPGGGYRLYYLGFAPGVTRDDHAGHVLSASSPDAEVWTPDPGVRVDVHPPHATLRTLCPDVVPMPDGGYRMYFEARVPAPRTGEHDFRTAILSATSADGLEWTPEEGVRLSGPEWTYGTPRCVYFPTEQGLLYRLYFHRYPYPLSPEPYRRTIIGSAVSLDGLRFELEAGARIPQETRGSRWRARRRRSSGSATAPSGCTTPPGRRASTAASSPPSRTTGSNGRSRRSRCSTWTRRWTRE